MQFRFPMFIVFVKLSYDATAHVINSELKVCKLIEKAIFDTKYYFILNRLLSQKDGKTRLKNLNDKYLGENPLSNYHSIEANKLLFHQFLLIKFAFFVNDKEINPEDLLQQEFRNFFEDVCSQFFQVKDKNLPNEMQTFAIEPEKDFNYIYTCFSLNKKLEGNFIKNEPTDTEHKRIEINPDIHLKLMTKILVYIQNMICSENTECEIFFISFKAIEPFFSVVEEKPYLSDKIKDIIEKFHKNHKKYIIDIRIKQLEDKVFLKLMEGFLYYIPQIKIEDINAIQVRALEYCKNECKLISNFIIDQYLKCFIAQDDNTCVKIYRI